MSSLVASGCGSRHDSSASGTYAAPSARPTPAESSSEQGVVMYSDDARSELATGGALTEAARAPAPPEPNIRRDEGKRVESARQSLYSVVPLFLLLF